MIVIIEAVVVMSRAGGTKVEVTKENRCRNDSGNTCFGRNHDYLSFGKGKGFEKLSSDKRERYVELLWFLVLNENLGSIRNVVILPRQGNNKYCQSTTKHTF